MQTLFLGNFFLLRQFFFESLCMFVSVGCLCFVALFVCVLEFICINSFSLY